MKHHIVELDDYEHSSNSEPVRLTPHLIVDGRQEGFIRSLQNGCQVYEEQGACSDIHGADLLGHSSLRRLLNFPAHHATIAHPIAINNAAKAKALQSKLRMQGRGGCSTLFFLFFHYHLNFDEGLRDAPPEC